MVLAGLLFMLVVMVPVNVVPDPVSARPGAGVQDIGMLPLLISRHANCRLGIRIQGWLMAIDRWVCTAHRWLVHGDSPPSMEAALHRDSHRSSQGGVAE
jgi:hypothetical protein